MEEKKNPTKKLEAKETAACSDFFFFLQYSVVFEESFNKIISKNKLVNFLLNICIMIHSSVDMFVSKRDLSL